MGEPKWVSIRIGQERLRLTWGHGGEGAQPRPGGSTNEAICNLGAKRGRRPQMNRPPSAQLVRRAVGIRPKFGSPDPPMPDNAKRYVGQMNASLTLLASCRRQPDPALRPSLTAWRDV